MGIMRKILVFLSLILLSVNIFQWRDNQFKNDFSLSLIDSEIKVNSIAAEDLGKPMFSIRFFHNKVENMLMKYFHYNLYFLDINFLLSVLLPIGVLGIFSGIIRIFNKSKRVIIYLSLLFLIYSFFRLVWNFKIDYMFKLILFITPYFVFSLYGLINLPNIFVLRKLKINTNIALFVVLLFSIGWHFYFGGGKSQFTIGPY